MQKIPMHLTMEDSGDSFIMNKTNVTGQTPLHEEKYILDLIIPLTVIYVFILIAGVLGNLCTVIVILKNKTMHTATNFYLLSLAVSDLILLLCGLPFEIHKIWYPEVYPWGNLLCISTGLAAETAANATVLTITAFTVERYLAICRPFTSRATSYLSRAVKCIIVIWVIALLTAAPLVFQYAVISMTENGQNITACTVKGVGFHQVFVLSSFFFFIIPMSVITVLYVRIGKKLRKSRVLQPAQMTSVDSIDRAKRAQFKNRVSQRRVIRMLIAVTLAFFICWAPFHVQRVIAMYGKRMDEPSDTFYMVYEVLTYVSGVLYFLSTAINPVLYSIMSHKFRNAFKVTLSSWCKKRPSEDTYSTLLASQARARHLHRFRMSTIEYNEYDGTSTVQCNDMGDEPTDFESTSSLENWSRGWPLDLNEETDSFESPHSISNSSLRQIGEEYSGEEMTAYLYQTNCLIRGVIHDTSV